MLQGKNIGIITLPGNFNYGNRLQCYAMSEIVKGLGGRPEVLEREHCYTPIRRFARSIKGKLGDIAGHGSFESAEKLRTPARSAAFDRFAELIPTRVLPGYGYAEAGKYDYLFVGSDQVWNPNEIQRQEKWYFASFAAEEQRIAVAASLGIDSFTNEKQKKSVSKGVSGFRCVSVREKRGAELIKCCSGIDAEIICDPTLVISSDEWRRIASGACTPSGAYVLTYLLGGRGEEAVDVLDSVTDGGRIPVIPLSDRQKSGEPDAGPAEFIDLIDNATHVVTDSFHAAVFSAILQTPLTIVHREGGVGMFSRLEQLSQMLDIEDKVYGTPSYNLNSSGDFGGVSMMIKRERSHFIKYLEGCLDG